MFYTISSASAEKTEAIAEKIGQKLRGGEVIELVSDLGGGKTTFVRGLARGAGSSDHVASPTFTISREYQAGKLTFYHFDFYRLNEPGVMASELQELIGDPQAVIIVEWSDIVQHVLPPQHLKIEFTQTGEIARQLAFSYPKKLAYLIKQ
jgi:tRNA threonylcarbamoyladenosine biosynthesis protein TsaE